MVRKLRYLKRAKKARAATRRTRVSAEWLNQLSKDLLSLPESSETSSSCVEPDHQESGLQDQADGLQVKADGCQKLHAILQRHGLTIIPAHKVIGYEKTINCQAEEIKALEYRIATLLRPEQ